MVDSTIVKFQNILKEKGISKEQLNMEDFQGLTENELQIIVDNPKPFMLPTAEDNLAAFKAITTNIPTEFTKSEYISLIDWNAIFKGSNSLESTQDEVVVFDFIYTHDVDEIYGLIKAVVHDFESDGYDSDDCTKWDDRFDSDDDFRGFAYVAKLLSPNSIVNNSRYKERLYYAYDKYVA